jgi:hypothetical protein
MAVAIDAVDVVTTLPDESSTLTTTGGVIVEPCVAFEGWTLKTSCVATFDMSKLALVTLVRPELAAVSVTPEAYAVPAHPENVTTPLVGVFDVPDVQLSVSPLLIVRETDDA